MTVKELQQTYNRTLILFNEGSAYMDNPSVTQEKKEEALQAFLKLIEKANKIIYKLKQQGESVTDKQILEGFKEVKINE